MLAAIDIALLESEWGATSQSEPWICPVCGRDMPGLGRQQEGHEVGCAMDQALSERGWATAQERDAARKRLHEATSQTEPAPAGAT
jgi:hypothetical protein